MMPSASAKLEKQTSLEALEPVKQIVTMVEKKVRNLEKRKAKLDAYRNDRLAGKELNDDQKKAVEKYDQVVEVLEFAKELQKSFGGIIQETTKAQKKVAKREHLERHQHELQRIKEIISIQDILNSMDGDDVRNDFLNETNGAVKLTDKELNSLDELYKLISPERDPESQDSSEFDRQLLSAAEHMQALLDSKSKEVIGTTYKELREIISKIHSCNYFNKAAVAAAAVAASCSPEPASNDSAGGGDSNENVGESYNEGEDPQTFSSSSYQADVKTSSVGNSNIQSHVDSSYYQSEATTSYQDQNRPLQDMLPVQGNLNFLQESQIDLEVAPVLDKQAAASHSVASPPGVGFPTSFTPASSTSVTQVMVSPRFQQRPKEETNNMISHHSQAQVLSAMAGAQNQQQQQQQQQPVGLNLPSQNSSGATPADFDPKQPIPTQTFTNQNFSGIHPLMAAAAAGVAVPQSYVPVTMAHGMPPQHMLPASIVSQQQVQARGATAPASGVLDPSGVLPSSVHSQTARLPVTSATKLNLSTHDSKEHFGRDFLMSQVSRENPHLGHQTNAQFDRVGTHEGYQPTSNSQTFITRENFGTDSSSYSSNLKRGMPPRNLARTGAATTGRGASNVPRSNRPAYRT